jgi:adenosine deaminase
MTRVLIVEDDEVIADGMARHLEAGQDLADIVAGLSDGLAAGEAETGTRVMLVCDMDRAYGGTAARELTERLIELRRAGAAGTERVIGVGMDSTELGVDPVDFVDAYRLAAKAGLRRTAWSSATSSTRSRAIPSRWTSASTMRCCRQGSPSRRPRRTWARRRVRTETAPIRT